MSKKLVTFAAVCACACATPASLAASALAASPPPHPHPLITDPAGDAKAGPNSFNRKDIDVLSADVTVTGGSISFAVKDAGATPLLLGGPAAIETFGFGIAGDLGVTSTVLPGSGTATIAYGTCGDDGCDYDSISGTLTVDRASATTTATYSLAELNALRARYAPRSAPVTTQTVGASAGVTQYEQVAANTTPHRDDAATYTPFTLGG